MLQTTYILIDQSFFLYDKLDLLMPARRVTVADRRLKIFRNIPMPSVGACQGRTWGNIKV
jgi:hypothetical protein